MAILSARLDVTTIANGTGSVTYALSNQNRLLYAVEWIDGTFDDGVDAALKCVETESGVDQTLLTLTNANNDAWYYPRTTEDDEAGAALTTRGMLVVNGDLKLEVTNGGNAKTGGCIVYYVE